jgi:hypothetical protein
MAIGTRNGVERRERAIRSAGGPRPAMQLALGLGLVAIWWPIAWTQLRPLSDHYFFPLWFGYILTIDALTALRTGTSPLRRGRAAWTGMFLLSVGLWWIFETFNEIVGNWVYHMPVRYNTLEYALLASLAFSTVIPAVLTTTELVRSFHLDPLSWLPAIRTTTTRLVVVHVAGWLMLLLTILWPSYAFPLVWMSLIFLLDPVATSLGERSIAWYLGRRDWSIVFNLGVGTLICGFFWEMWNLHALPKWTYDVPHVGFWHVFEMPVLGYSGYLPFGLEVYVFYVVTRRLLGWNALPEPVVSSSSSIDRLRERPL